jgi:alkanesulfonate monooxygenase SsuD/methylene tetrahydromethanopterin reductase-like flavin-dependent oxidoreductase (luciferase family)
LISAAIALADQDTATVVLGVYQLALRHPVTVARQLATLSQIAPGRLVLGVGVGGEDRVEVANCGVNPATRGRRLDESLAVLSRLADGSAVSIDGRFFTLRDARILPPPDPAVPIVVGGRGDAAARRAGRYGDGWLGIYVSPARYAAMAQQVRAEAARAGRAAPTWFGLNLWCAFSGDEPILAARMEQLYRLPFISFARYSPTGTPESVAAALHAYVEAGCTDFTLTVAGDDPHAGVDAVAEVRRLLRTG